MSNTQHVNGKNNLFFTAFTSPDVRFSSFFSLYIYILGGLGAVVPVRDPDEPGINDSLVKWSVLTTRRDLSRLLKQTRIAHLQASLTFH